MASSNLDVLFKLFAKRRGYSFVRSPHLHPSSSAFLRRHGRSHLCAAISRVGCARAFASHVNELPRDPKGKAGRLREDLVTLCAKERAMAVRMKSLGARLCRSPGFTAVVRRQNGSINRGAYTQMIPLYHSVPQAKLLNYLDGTPADPEDLIHISGDRQDGRRPDQPQKSVEDVLWDMFRTPENKVPIGKFLTTLRATGLRKTDPRLKELMDSLKNTPAFRSGDVSSTESLILDEEIFKSVVLKNIVLISRALRGQFIIPDFTGFAKHIEEFYWKCKSNHAGKVADYIPQLARYSPDYWGVSLCTVDGQRFAIGDVDVPFTVQSCAKPISYAISLDAVGSDAVHKYIGQEPSGRMFNELVLDHNKKPHNPMINAGAIVTCSILLSLVKPELTISDKFDFVANYFKRMAGNEFLGFSNATFLSERETGDRNYALGFYMRENKCFPAKANLKETLDFYFQLCSMETTCDAFSVIAATLANGGICPITEESVLNSSAVRDMLSLMHSCGMYDYSGQFAFKIGLPAKSGVSGAMILVVPNVMGMCLWSPPLDHLGNTVRGVQFCEELVNMFNFHRYDNLKHTAQKRDPRRHKFETKGLQIVNLLFSAASGDLAAMRRHYLSGVDMAQCDYDGRTALHLAAAEGHMECVDFLLKKCKVPTSPKDRWSHTPLDDAKNFDQLEIIKLLEAHIAQFGDSPEDFVVDKNNN